MQVALEATSACIRERTGVARYVVCLVEALLARGGVEVELLYRLSRFRRRALRYAPRGARLRWVQEPVWPLLGRPALVHGLDARVPAWTGAVRVATVHDVFHLVSDRFASPRFNARRARATERLVATADHLVCDSEATRGDLVARAAVPAERTSVIPLGVEERFAPTAAARLPEVRARLGLPERYLLFVGHVAARKNVARLVRAHARSRAARELPLVLAGTDGYGAEELDAALAGRASATDVRRVGYAADADLPALYAGADAFCFPSLYEGFGLPVLEALRSGVPVLTSDRGSLPEVAAGHATLADPEDEDALAAGLDRALATPPAAREAGRRYAEGCTWARCAEAHVALWQRLLSERGAVRLPVAPPRPHP